MAKEQFTFEKYKSRIGGHYWNQFDIEQTTQVLLFEQARQAGEIDQPLWKPPKVVRYHAFMDRKNEECLLSVADDGLVLVGKLAVHPMHFKKYFNYIHDLIEPRDFDRACKSPYYTRVMEERKEAAEVKKLRTARRAST